MADDERPDAADPEIGAWLEVEPLDDVTRRRLVSTALGETEPAAAPNRPSHRWRWLAAAAAVVAVVLVGGLAVLTANGGHDEQQATRDQRAAVTPKSADAARDVGDFGNLDDASNLAALRSALEQPAAAASAPQAAGDASTSDRSTELNAGGSAPLSLCGAVLSEDTTIVAQGTGTIEGRHATVLLVESADGTRSFEVVLEDPCELRQLP